MKAITTRIPPATYEQLIALANEKGVTLGNLMRRITEFFCENKLDVEQPVYQGKDHLCHMVEQIHAVMPHLVMYSRTAYANAVQSMDEAKSHHLTTESLKKTTEICGGFQTVDYQTTPVSYNFKGLKTIPIEPHKSTWR